MKKYFLLASLLCLVTSIFAQMSSPVSWTFEAKPIDASHFELHMTAAITGDWNIYSQYIDEGGPVPTAFSYEDGDHFELVGKCEEKGDRKEGFDDLFEMDVIKFAKQVDFVQKVSVKNGTKQIKGSVEFMVCNDESCLPPKLVDFTIDLDSK